MAAKRVTLFSLSTCGYCQAIKKMFEDLRIEHTVLQVDELEPEARKKAMIELRRVNEKCSFPTVIIDDEVVVGYKVQEIKERAGIRTEVDELYDRLKKINEPKGYYLNGNREKTFELLRGLLTNKDRYGYMACPCRLASGVIEKDRDIICPCTYREPDVKQYGSCYCALYVSKEWYTGKIKREEVPERRPPEMYDFE